MLSPSSVRKIVFLAVAVLQSCASANFSREFENSSIRFSRLTSMPSSRAYMGYCSNGQTTFVIGGESRTGESFDNILSFNTKSNSWNEVTPVHINAEKNINSAISSGSMFLFNGTKGQLNSPLSPIDINVREVSYNNRIPKVDNVSINPQPLFKAGICEHKGYIYLYGGMVDHETYSNTLYRFNAKKKQWKQMAHLPKQMITYGQIVDNKLYVFGGQNDKPIDEIYMYNIKVDRWVKVGKLPEPIVDAAITSYKHYIILFSNEQVFVYDTHKGSLMRFQTNIGELKGMGATISNNNLIIFGGIKINNSGKEVFSSAVYKLDISKIIS
ncbi:hypothetical protein EI427_04200 [Flammeovirga pectinis]|uniref:Galactose oxidase n=1 Tax=Flammeovirga pectinis TaxID=2494373 RepID=A0A3Q9FJX9_9BACT|nr:kelch repeat-containing protein [Flammeovirga pectinis]AZQ61454.1 hypothetical protein EI427_04200 [Flammeovirga pectinis]